MNSLAQVEREFQQRQQHIQEIGALAITVADANNDTIKQVTADAIRTLKDISAQLGRSGLPADQQAALRRQAQDALARHEHLLNLATNRSQRVLIETINKSPRELPPPPKPSGWNEFSDGVNNGIHFLTGGLFREKDR
jgi:hypothetical protein